MLPSLLPPFNFVRRFSYGRSAEGSISAGSFGFHRSSEERSEFVAQPGREFMKREPEGWLS
jgi:hypothetical protein